MKVKDKKYTRFLLYCSLSLNNPLHLREVPLFAERLFQKIPGSSSVNMIPSPLAGEGQGEGEMKDHGVCNLYSPRLYVKTKTDGLLKGVFRGSGEDYNLSVCI